MVARFCRVQCWQIRSLISPCALGHDPLFTKATEQAHKHRFAIDHIVEATKP